MRGQREAGTGLPRRARAHGRPQRRRARARPRRSIDAIRAAVCGRRCGRAPPPMRGRARRRQRPAPWGVKHAAAAACEVSTDLGHEDMAILKVARLGHPILRRVAEPVSPEAIGAPEIQRLIDDMLETMEEYDGAGLAAPQVHVSRRVVIYGVRKNPRYPDPEEGPLTVPINPEITAATNAVAEGWEGGLSPPDLRGQVARFTRVHVEAYGRDGAPLRFTADGCHARVIQHECDHLDGVVYVDRMSSMATLSFLPEFHRYWLGREPDGDD